MKYLQLAHSGACTKLKRKTYKFTVYKFVNFTISTFWSIYKAEKNKDILLCSLYNYLNAKTM